MSSSDEIPGAVTEVEVSAFAVSAFSALRRLHQELLQYQNLLSPEGQRLLGYAQAILDARCIDAIALQKALRSLVAGSDGGFNDYPYVFDQIQQAKHVLRLRVQGDLENAVLRRGDRGAVRVMPVTLSVE